MESPGNEGDAAERLRGLVGDVVDLHVEEDPVWATHMGRHERDHELPDESPAARERFEGKARELRAALNALPDDELDLDGRVDRDMVLNRLELAALVKEELRPHARDPLRTNMTMGAGLHELVSRARPEPERAVAFLARLEALPAYLQTAASNLEDPPRVHLEVAASQVPGLVELTRAFDHLGDGAPAGWAGAGEAARGALQEWQRSLHGRIEAADPDGWRLGTDLYTRKRALELDLGPDPEDLDEAAFDAVLLCHRQLLDAARRLEGTATPHFASGDPLTESERDEVRAGLARVAIDRVEPGELVSECRRAVDEVLAFTLERDLVGPMPDDVLRVEEWPPFGRGVAIACLDAPGPFEPAGAESRFYICPVPEEWPAEQVDSFLREYNRHQLRCLAAHEAYPGHFVQIAHARRHPSLARGAFASGTMVEGWAVYVEELLLEEGFDGGSPEYALAFWKMRLRTALNAVLDHSLHTGARPPDRCLRMLEVAGFQEAGEAEGKVRRAMLTSCQLSTYFAGVRSMIHLRRAAEGLAGEAFSLSGFHRSLLSHGSVSPRHLARLMEVDP